MYGCESWTIKKAERQRTDAFDSCESLGLKKDKTSQSSRKSVLNIHWKDWCWCWSSKTLATWCKELNHWKRPWCWERSKAGGEMVDRGWNGWMVWTQTGWLDMTEQLDWTKLNKFHNSHSPQLCMWFFHIRLHFTEVFLKVLPQTVLIKEGPHVRFSLSLLCLYGNTWNYFVIYFIVQGWGVLRPAFL